MKRALYLSLLLLLGVLLYGCGAASTGEQVKNTGGGIAATSGAYHKISPEQVEKLIDSGVAMILVDVRTAGEYKSGHIKGAVNIPVEQIVSSKPTQLTSSTAQIIVYCATGNRSKVAVEKLAAYGYTEAYDMGGLNTWSGGVVTGDAATTASPVGTAGGVLSSFTAKDLDGNFVTAALLRDNKLTMVNIWATFCNPCISEMSGLGKLSAAYKDKGVMILGIVIDASDSTGVAIPEMLTAAKDIVAKTGAAYRHLVPSTSLNTILLDSVSAVPTTIFVDAQGNQIGETYVGAHTDAEWTAILDKLLQEVK